jgi:hypothetical protein
MRSGLQRSETRSKIQPERKKMAGMEAPAQRNSTINRVKVMLQKKEFDVKWIL